ncbi:MAG: alpha/beta hydrolase [Sphingomonadales bacterium]|nr:MAG: alpha/beta hydrolase [Sphingomonadales bacterium]
MRAPIPVGDAEIGARIYRPGAWTKGLIVWVHGGGFVLGNPAGCDNFCRLLANRSGCTVVSLDYRLAPEYPFPIPVNDVLAATKWIARRRKPLAGGDVPLFLGGDSAGGNLTAVVSRKLAEAGDSPLAGQILVYPCTDDGDAASLTRFDPPFLTQPEMAWFFDQYDPGRANRDHPDFAPLKATSLAGLPPAIVVTAEHDILTEQAEAYGRKLQAAGVDVRFSRHPGMIHGFAAMDVFFEGEAGKAIDAMVAFVGKPI